MIREYVNFSGFFVGEVCDVDKETHKLLLYIPKLMPGINKRIGKEKGQVIGLSSRVKIKHSHEINRVNGMWINAGNMDDPLPLPESKVLIIFFENDPEKGYWFKFNPNGQSSYEEKEDSNSVLLKRINDLENRIKKLEKEK